MPLLLMVLTALLARRPQLAAYVSLTEYAKDIHNRVAFPPEELNNVLGEWLAKQVPQLRISETEKYAHVTFFFSGGREQNLMVKHAFWCLTSGGNL